AEVAGQVRELAGGGADVPSGFLVGAQNMYFESQGAFTGEISGEMIRGVGGNAVILGHSERRHIFGEADDLVGKKVRRALEAELTPILCVGETLEEREADRTQEVVERQLRAGLALLEDAAQLLQVIIAYEPVWAIGTGRTASPDDAQEVHRFIREELRGSLTRRTDSPQGDQGSQEISILYGGSVKPENAGDLLAQPDIDGALVGGASLAADSFLGICRASTAA
ncbi:MAG: triose-phosphate isomerase, partial [Planctomycetota bacterium]|nr:triose-phosphate isomerase [Planctomycetota bacterium]